jgi:phosphoribosyl-ATP pyrophosphohydrolase
VGGGIRDLNTARSWLDAGAGRIMIGTAASPEFCAALPRERVVAAVDAVQGEIVVDGWRRKTGRAALETIERLAPFVGGFLLTQVEREGEMAGFDLELVQAAISAAGDARLTAAGGITGAREIAQLDRLGADAQVGMALYRGRLDLAEAFAAPLTDESQSLWPTLVCDESGRALGMVWSNPESLRRAITERRGIYWSRSRQDLWVKGESSGNTQELLAVDLDCDRDAIRFIVRQSGTGFCHRGTRTCFPDRFDLGALERVIRDRARAADRSSGTWRLLNEPGLLASKLREESAELAAAGTPDEVVHEAADLLYLLLATLERSGSSLAQVEAELGRRRLRVSRRPMEAKT